MPQASTAEQKHRGNLGQREISSTVLIICQLHQVTVLVQRSAEWKSAPVPHIILVSYECTMHNNSGLGKVVTSSRIKVGMLLQYTISLCLFCASKARREFPMKPGQSWVFLSALCLSGSIQPCLNSCSNARSKKAHLTLYSHHTLMWCDRSAPPLLSAQPTANSHTRPFAGLLPRTEFYICIFNQPVSGLQTFGVDRTS